LGEFVQVIGQRLVQLGTLAELVCVHRIFPRRIRKTKVEWLPLDLI
jgi:hypothetical protein